jgi:hypothetical protein
MKTLISINMLLLVLSLGALPALSQTTNSKTIKTENTMKASMKTYVIEREIPNAGK